MDGHARVTVRGLRGDQYAGAGTTVSVDAGPRRAIPTFSPGTWQADRELKAGDSYEIEFHSPRPNVLELSAAAAARAASRATRSRASCRCCGPSCPTPTTRARGPSPPVKLELRPFDVVGPPLAQNERRGTEEPGVPALRNSPYWRTWQLAQRLKRGARTPYEFVRRVDNYLGRGFRYDERPAPARPGEMPLEHFLFETKAGYCQHFSGAMALLLRFGGVPARVATGFSPGGFRRARASGSCATATRTRGSRRGSTASAGSRSTRRRRRRRRAR